MLVTEENDYITLLLPDNFDPLSIADKVAKPISLSGELELVDGKQFMQVSTASLSMLQSPVSLDQTLTMCSSGW